MPRHIQKQSCFSYHLLTNCKNDALSRGIFPDSLIFSNVMPVYKKMKLLIKKNYRSVSELPLFSETFDKVIYDQLSQ